VAGTSPAQREAEADRLLGADIEGVDLQAAPVLMAALQGVLGADGHNLKPGSHASA
jgi:hypothetical protein